MTTPVQQGQPDWLRQLASANIEIIRKSESISGLKTYGPLYVGNTPFIYLRADCATGMNVGVAWFADAAGTKSLFGDVVTTPAGGGDGKGCIPARGPFVKFTVERSAYPGTINLDAFAVPSRHNVYAGSDGENTLIEQDGVNVGIGATATYDATVTRWGRVYWRGVLEAATSSRIKLYAVDFTGATHLLDYCNQDLGSGGRMVLAPALPLRVTVFNNTAGILQAYVSVQHHPFDY